MGCQWYLAMTAAELMGCESLPGAVAWMACHFSCYGTGLSNLPKALPTGSILILNDRTPIQGHDPERIAEQLLQVVQEQEISGVLLDLQRQDCPDAAQIIDHITRALPCPVAVTEYYAQGLDCDVFLSPPLHKPLKDALKPWQGRKVWLDIPLGRQVITVTAKGSEYSPLFPSDADEYPHEDASLHCRYRTRVSQEQIKFTLCRAANDLEGLLKEAEALKIPRAIGLYQEYKNSQFCVCSK